MKLMGRITFLAGRHQVKPLKPLMQCDMAALHDSLHGDGEVLSARFLGTTEHARAIGFEGMIDDTAMRANRAIRPKHAFEVGASRVVVLEMRG